MADLRKLAAAKFNVHIRHRSPYKITEIESRSTSKRTRKSIVNKMSKNTDGELS